MGEILKNIKQEPSEEFLCCLPLFDDGKTLGGKVIKVEKVKIDRNEKSKEPNDENPKFLCEICNESFQFKCNLTKHVKSHDKIQCQICNRTVRKISFEKHLKAHENEKEKKFRCKLCPRKFLSKSNLSTHQKVHKGKQFGCDLCGSFFSLKTILKNHLNFHIQGGKYKCLHCRLLFDLQNDLKFHSMNRQMNPKICQRMKESELSCRTCGKEFKTTNERKIHEKIHMDKVECPMCHAKLKQNAIKDHLKNHEMKKGEKDFNCSECPKKFWTKKTCSEHEKTHNKFECDHCGAEIALKIYFLEHLKAHFNPQSVDCKDCEKNFSVQSKLKGHIKRCHPSGSNDFKCKICKKIFKTCFYLKKHKKVHDPKKTCPICSKSLAAYSYSIHIKRHGDKKKISEIECDLSGKTFKSKRSIKKHMTIHLNLYPFRCHKCGKVFRQSSHLKRHMTSMHEKKYRNKLVF